MKFGYIWPSSFRGEVVKKCGWTTDASHTISSPGAFGSGELKSGTILAVLTEGHLSNIPMRYE